MKRIAYPLLIVVCASLTACSTSETQAPIENRSTTPALTKTVPVGPGYYAVMKGDTLYRISRTYGQNVSDLAAWNNLSNINDIKEGQVLRVVPPGTEGAPVQTASVGGSDRDVQPIAKSQTGTADSKQPSSESAAVGGVAAAPSTPAPEKATTSDGVTREVGGVVWAWPANGKVLRGFSDGVSKGLDIDGAKGEKVLAAASGRVIYAGQMPSYGNLVIIKHNDDLLSAYAHNTKNLVTQGDTISRGQQVAEMGSSGTDSVKLHFEVRRQGKPVDPMSYLPKR